MDDLTREEIARLLAEAWPGPWRMGKYALSDGRGRRIVSWDYATNDDPGSTAEADNCEIIEAARAIAEQLDRALAENERLRTQRDAAREVLAEVLGRFAPHAPGDFFLDGPEMVHESVLDRWRTRAGLEVTHG